MKNGCPFIVFIPNNRDIFVMELCVLVEIENKCIVNILPYLGAKENESRQEVSLEEHVVLSLTEVIEIVMIM